MKYHQNIDRLIKEYLERIRANTSAENLALKGHWAIFGEDPNPDMGGSHSEPFMGVVHGTFWAACMYAVKLPGFLSWGYGGKIKLQGIVEVLESDFAELQARILERIEDKAKLLLERDRLRGELDTLERKLRS